MGEFGEAVVKHLRAREDQEDSDSKLRSNGSEVGKDEAFLPDVPPDVPDALRSTREALDLVVACMVALLLLLIVLTIVATIVTRLVDFFKQRKQMKTNFGTWRRKGPHPSSRPLSQILAHSPLTSPKSTPLPPTGPYRAVAKPPGARALPKMVPPSAPPAERDFLARP